MSDKTQEAMTVRMLMDRRKELCDIACEATITGDERLRIEAQELRQDYDMLIKLATRLFGDVTP